MTDVPRFTTERTELRRWRPDEAPRLLDLRRRPEVARWLSDPEPWTELEIGWSLHPDTVRRGYAREAARVVLDHGLALGRGPVWAVTWPHNERSAEVCRAIGMTDLGVVDDPWYGTADEPTSRIFRADPPPAGSA